MLIELLVLSLSLASEPDPVEALLVASPELQEIALEAQLASVTEVDQRQAEYAAAWAAEPEPDPPVETDAEPEPDVREDARPARNVWDDLADCESGNWVDRGASFEEGSARWDWAKPGADSVPPWGTTIHHGGLQFLPSTWEWLKPDGFPQHAYDATREQQIEVAERVLDAQGWQAWPVCSRKLGLR